MGEADAGTGRDVISVEDTEVVVSASGTTVTLTCSVLVMCVVVVFGWMSWTTSIDSMLAKPTSRRFIRTPLGLLTSSGANDGSIVGCASTRRIVPPGGEMLQIVVVDLVRIMLACNRISEQR